METEPIVAWRAWEFMAPGFLTDLNRAFVYEPRKVAEARCDRDHAPPQKNCVCGIWAVKTREELQRLITVGAPIIGEVFLWGRYLETERGYRAQYCYPKRLVAISDYYSHGRDLRPWVPWVGHVYGVPVETDLRQKQDLEETDADVEARRLSVAQLTNKDLDLIMRTDRLPVEARKGARQLLLRKTYTKLKQTEASVAKTQNNIKRALEWLDMKVPEVAKMKADRQEVLEYRDW